MFMRAGACVCGPVCKCVRVRLCICVCLRVCVSHTSEPEPAIKVVLLPELFSLAVVGVAVVASWVWRIRFWL